VDTVFYFTLFTLAARSWAGPQMSVESARSVLGIDQQASESEAKNAYRSLMQKWHPDLNPNDPQAREQAAKINNAWDVLRNHYQHSKIGPNKYHVRDASPIYNSRRTPVSPKEWADEFANAFKDENMERLIKSVTSVTVEPSGRMWGEFSENKFEGLIIFFDQHWNTIASRGTSKELLELLHHASWGASDVLSSNSLQKLQQRYRTLAGLALDKAPDIETYLKALRRLEHKNEVLKTLSLEDLVIRNNKLVFSEKFDESVLEVLALVAGDVEKEPRDTWLIDFWLRYGDILQKHEQISTELEAKTKASLIEAIQRRIKKMKGEVIWMSGDWKPASKLPAIKDLNGYLRMQKNSPFSCASGFLKAALSKIRGGSSHD
jgi:hypothetical protein